MGNKLVAALIAAARADVGYLEKASNALLDDRTANAGKNNWTKFGAWYGLNPAPWCAMAVSRWANLAGIPESVIPKYHSCGVGIEWFKTRGLFHPSAGYTPQAGDIVFFQAGDNRHTGVVTGFDGAKVHTVEGNTSGGSTMIPNGGGVAAKSYNPSYKLILGYGTPDYGAVPGAGPDLPPARPLLRRGAAGDDVRTLQSRLHVLKFPCGPVDGDFGFRTQEAVKAFQAARGLFVDGEVGPLTWKELMNK
jgi:hypothetical protein